MRIGFIGLGKLGYPCAAAIAWKGHDVIGYDINPDNMTHDARPYRETSPDGKIDFNFWFQNCLSVKENFRFGSMQKVAEQSEIIFLAIQTPHEFKYEGSTIMPNDRKDFNYKYLKQAILDLKPHIKRKTIIVIISTVLPGTIRREILPLCNEYMQICYNPFFIAMGTAMRDFLNPEFILFGEESKEASEKAEWFYKTITNAPFYKTTIENAELIKVSYNTFIGMKIIFANTIMEICDKLPGCDVDSVTDALKLATDRIISPKYLSGGTGDGGGCHPRDNIAMSFIAKKLNLSTDLFDSISRMREQQTEYIANMAASFELPIMMLGYSYKPESNLIVGSCAVLMKNILQSWGHEVEMHDPYVDSGKSVPLRMSALADPLLIIIGCKHKVFQRYTFPKGSVVIDPFRYIQKQDGIKVIHVGKSKSKENMPLTRNGK